MTTVTRVPTTAPGSLPATGHLAAVAARAVGATKTYGRDEAEVRALDGVDIELEAGRFTAITRVTSHRPSSRSSTSAVASFTPITLSILAISATVSGNISQAVRPGTL